MLKLGENIQSALQELQEQTKADFDYHSNDTSQKLYQMRSDI